MRTTGAQVIVKCLVEQGVDTVFGYPGGAILPLYDALYEAPFQHVLTVHEQGAAHAADGYARASGRVGVCIATSGPGATNLVTGLANAYMDSIPIVAITGQVNTGLIGRDAFQEVDITGITLPITKHNFLVKDINKLAKVMRQAFQIARSGRPGPVLVDVPRDIQVAEVDFCPEVLVSQPVRQLTESTCQRIGEAAAAIQSAKRPVMYIGGGVILAEAHQEIRVLAQKCKIPVASTLMGLGGFPASDPGFLGLSGMHGYKAANKAIHEADVIIAVGSRFSDRGTGDRERYASGKTVIHIDVDPAEIDKNVNALMGLTGDIRQIVAQLTAQVEATDLSEWWSTIRQWQSEFIDCGKPAYLTAPWMMRHISEVTAGQPTVFVTDTGQHQMWAAQYLAIEQPRTWITSGGLGAMGFGLPAAIGAQLSVPAKRIIHFAGDGGFKMTGAELYTVAAHGLPIISIIVNNNSLGMVRQLQELFFKGRYSNSLLPTPMDFTTFAKAFGIEGVAVDNPEDFVEALAAALADDRPRVIVANIQTEDLVWPMVAPGATLDEYVTGMK
ncbi:MAG TPA: biosynthetic-type acetolactate synthase large subunit [Negativicutes bacterium]|jgi:acetolactate synthase-1/2/3 large subunit